MYRKSKADPFERYALFNQGVRRWYVYISRSYLLFVSGPEEDYSIILEYKSIGVHAVTHETIIWNRPCIYCQISQVGDEDDQGFDIMYGNTEMDEMPDEEEEEEEDKEEEEEDSVFELLLSPMDSLKSTIVLLK